MKQTTNIREFKEEYQRSKFIFFLSFLIISCPINALLSLTNSSQPGIVWKQSFDVNS